MFIVKKRKQMYLFTPFMRNRLYGNFKDKANLMNFYGLDNGIYSATYTIPGVIYHELRNATT